jgi:ABC-type glycerol-3-phosphate transport system substrate-binding protein
MKKIRLCIFAGMALVGLTACGGTAGNLGLGALSGAAAGAGVMNIHLKTQKNQVGQVFKDKKIE